MPLRYLSDPTARLSSFDRNSRFFRILYGTLWMASDMGTRAILTQGEVEVVDWSANDPLQVASDASTSFRHTIMDLGAIGVPTFLPNDRMLVRPEYKEVLRWLQSSRRHVVISGQPGIGMTHFLIYILCFRLLQGLPTMYARGPTDWFLFWEYGAYRFKPSRISTLSNDIRNLHATRGQPSVPWPEEKFGWILCDSVESQSVPIFGVDRFRLWRTVLVSPPEPETFRRWKEEQRARICIMKPWLWCEIVAASQLQSFGTKEPPTLEQLWKTYKRFGPTPRIVFGCWNQPKEYRRALSLAAKTCTTFFDLFPTTNTPWTTLAATANLVCIAPREKAGRLDRGTLVGGIPTPHISLIVHQKARGLIGRLTQSVFHDIATEDPDGDVTRWLWESACQRWVERCATARLSRAFSASPLRPSDSTLSAAAPSTPKYFIYLGGRSQVLFECFGEIPNHLGAPERYYFRQFSTSCPGVDAFAVIDGELVFFRCTRTLWEPIEVKTIVMISRALAPFLQAPPSGPRHKVVFIVPQAIAAGFKRQLLHPWTATPFWDRRIEQYVLGLADEEVWPS